MSTVTESSEEGKAQYCDTTILLVGPQNRPRGSVPAISTENISDLLWPLFVLSPPLIPLLHPRNIILITPWTTVNSFSSCGTEALTYMPFSHHMFSCHCLLGIHYILVLGPSVTEELTHLSHSLGAPQNLQQS